MPRSSSLRRNCDSNSDESIKLKKNDFDFTTLSATFYRYRAAANFYCVKTTNKKLFHLFKPLTYLEVEDVTEFNYIKSYFVCLNL